MEEDKVRVEEQFLYGSSMLIEKLLNQHFKSSNSKLSAFTERRIKETVRRVFDQEMDYLNEDPDNYFDLYMQDHLDN